MALVAFNKPYGVVSQFTPEGRWQGLSDFLSLPEFRVAGRLDADSEGLLLLTDNGALQARIAEPRHKLPKCYWAQVEGIPDDAALDHLRAGPVLNDGPTRACHVELLAEDIEARSLWPRNPPIRFRKAIPTTWIELIIREGRNRQVRRMTAAVGYPTLRLVRAAVGPYSLEGLAPGLWKQVSAR